MLQERPQSKLPSTTSTTTIPATTSSSTATTKSPLAPTSLVPAPVVSQNSVSPSIPFFSVGPSDSKFLNIDAYSSTPTSNTKTGEEAKSKGEDPHPSRLIVILEGKTQEEEQHQIVISKNQEQKSHSMEFQTLHPVIKSFLIGSVSGTCSTVLFQPLDLLKTRLQHNAPPTTLSSSSLHRYAPLTTPTASSATPLSMVSLLSHILRTENVSTLWRGMTPSLTRCVPGVGLYFATIHGLKTTLSIDGEPTAMQSLFLGVTGRSFSGVMMIPFTVIKTRFESKVYQYSSIREAWRCIYRQEGLRGLTCGLIPTLLRDAPFSGLYLMMYTSTKKAIGKEWMDSPTLGPYVRFSSGILAGVGASLVTQPFDVIKTKMQLYPEKFISVRHAVPYVFQKYGIQGYFKGLMPRMIRRTLIAAMSWTLYEQLIQSLGLK